MSTSAPPSKLPAWIFYATDLVLLLAAGFIAAEAPRPLSNAAIFAIVACVIVGAIVATVPRLVAYEREKNTALDARQSALEGLAQTITSSAEQISVAAAGLHAIAELTHKNLRQAEQLPHKLQDKIAEFQAQLANANDGEKEELEKELVALRSSESERLESISDRIAKSVAEFARLQTQWQKHLAATSAALSSAPAKDSSETKSIREREVSPAPPIAESIPNPPENAAPAPKPLPSRREASVPIVSTSVVTSLRTTHEIPVDEPPPAKPVEIAPVVPESRSPYPDHLVVYPGNANSAAVATQAATATVAPLKPLRKRTEKKNVQGASENLLDLELPAVGKPPAAEPVALATAVATLSQPKAAEAPLAPVIAADGATRLLVTAYIGIGNRLFIRGEGPGLSWEKGVPLQFVSIGKWRWEMANVTAPVKFKLFKNDETECALGLQSLAPGHQQEFTASF
ncbi:MAG: hypothetical protein ABIO94_00670 [Opitutaceae bacterium]